MITRNLFQKIGMLTVIGLAAASCSQDELTGNRGLNGNAVRFGIVTPTSTPAEDTPETRALNADDTPVMLLAPEGKDTLYLHPWVTENHSIPSASQNKATTRGVPVDEHNFASVCKSFGVTAYTQDGKLFMQDEKISKVSNGVWSPDETYFWPAEASLDFYAYAPYSNRAMTITDHKEITFYYTVPDQATAQPDIMFAHATGSKKTGTVSLGFKHALAGVKFVAKDVTNCTIKSITLQNLYAEGSCTYSTETETFAWTPSGDKKNFSQTFDVQLEEQETGEQQITDENPETTFMLIPQSLKDVRVEVQVETAEEIFTLTGSLAQTGKWEAGKIYTYAISTESINWEYVFNVTENIILALGETQKKYTVTSYRHRKGNFEEKEQVAWRAVNTSSSEKNLENNTSTNVTLDEILSEFTYAPTGESTDYDIILTETTLHTTYPGDQALKDATLKGSPDNPYDLSTHDENGADIPQTTANCYVVSAAGTYQLPLVYGNAIKNGSENSPAYQGGNFKDYQNNTINDSRITNADDAVLVWSDGFFMFKDIHLDEARKNLVFTIDPDYMQQANAVLAVRDANDQIMWSWHIWVTERNVYETIAVKDNIDNNITYGMMPCNLGWVDGKMVYYNQRDLTFTFTQDHSGITKEMTVQQEGAKFDYKDVGSTYYQWGRKDPLVALRNWDAYRFEDYRLHETGKPDYIYRCETGPASLGTSIQHPNVFYTRNNNVTDWNSEHIATLWNVQENGGHLNSTTSTKTIYDPSPRGFKVPVPRTFAIFVNGGTSTTDGGTLKGKVDPDNSHRYLISSETNNDGIEIPLTATGQRADRAGLEVYVPNDGKGEVGGLWALYGVYYWTCVHQKSGSSSAYTLVIRKDQPSGIEVYSYGFVGAKTMARPVRPVKED